MGFKKVLFERYLPPIVTSIIIGSLTYLYSLAKNISWIEVIYSIPQIIWIFLVIVFVLWITIITIRKKMNYPSMYYSLSPHGGWKNILRKDYFDVKWQVRTPIFDLTWDYELYERNRSSKVPLIDVAPIPRCPKCSTKLMISDHFLWYTWDCPINDFKKRSWKSIYEIRNKVQNIVDREVEMEIEKEN